VNVTPPIGDARLTPIDLVRVAASGLAARRVRAALSSLGIAIGIATIVAVVAIPASAKADLLARLARDGNLLTVEAGQTLDGTAEPLPATALGMIRRIPPVEGAVALGVIRGAAVRRSPAIPSVDTGGIAVAAADPSLLSTLDATVLHGTFLNAATSHYPAVVLGNAAAVALGIADLALPAQVDIDDHTFVVVGILNPTPLTPEVDQSVLIGFPIARSLLGFDGYATDIYIRAAPDQVPAVQQVLAATTNPESPEAVHVSRPSDVLAARASAKGAFNDLLLGLGAVALIVGGIGITNVMIISVLERRNEIGLRRALGAGRGHIATQFLAESLILSVIGGAVGVALGVWITVIYARAQSGTVSIPLGDAGIVLVAAMLVGGIAGVYPAVRAARLNPTEALHAA
jgi:putative ABC transport system permease protein